MSTRLPFAIAIAAFLSSLAAIRHPACAQDSLPAVNAVKVRSGTSKASYQLLGNVAPKRTATIGYAVPGRVRQVHVDRGDRLERGDKIADLQTDVIKIEIQAAKAQLRLVQQQLAELKTGSRREDIAEARARMEAAFAISKRSASQLKRLERLVVSRAASGDELDVASAEADSSRQLYQAAKIALDRLIEGPRPEQIAQAQANVDLQTEQVNLLEDRFSKHTLIAPFDGYVTSEFTAAGAWMTAGGPVIEMIELDTVEIEVAVPATQTVGLKPGQSIRIECPSRPDELLIGKLNRIVPAADTRARTFPVLIEIENRFDDQVPILMSGMVVKADMPIGRETQENFVPTDAIVLEGEKQSVIVATPESSASEYDKPTAATVRQVDVELGIARDGWIAIRGDLKPGELVVIRGNERLTDGQQVEVAVRGGQ